MSKGSSQFADVERQDMIPVKEEIKDQSFRTARRRPIGQHPAQMETERFHKQQLQLKDEFLSHVSHELRSPLTAIYEFVSIVSDGIAGEVNPQQSEYLQIALRNVLQLRSMIDDLLDVTRVRAGKLGVDRRCVSLGVLAADVMDAHRASAAAKAVHLSLNATDGGARAYADPLRIRQVLTNLVSNALKFTSAGGSVRVAVRVDERNPEFLRIEVSDTGCGIEPAAIPHIFERLYQVPESQAARKGLGLGLYICKELVARHGGEIWATSEPEKGSTFALTIPVFSVASLLMPLFRDETARDQAIALFTIRMCPPEDGWLNEEFREETSLQARNLLQQCLLPALDVLLPENGPTGSGEVVFLVAARAKAAGASVMSRRIEDQLARNEQLTRTGVAFHVSYTLIETNGQQASKEETVNGVAAKVQEQIDSISLAQERSDVS